MNGAEAMMRLAESYGSDVCFANPGTTELAFVAAIDSVEGVRPVLGLHENICTGAADGWARMTGEVGLTMLHLGVGLSNGLANLHNARRARTPIVSLVGDHPSWHLRNAPPLASDLYGVASAGTSRALVSSDFDTGSDAFTAAWASARTASAPVTFIVRAEDAVREQPPWSTSADRPCDSARLEARSQHKVAGQVLQRLARAHKPALLLGGTSMSTLGKRAAETVGSELGIAVFTEAFPSIEHGGRNLPRFMSLTGIAPANAQAQLRQHDLLVLIGADDPAAFFADQPELGRLRPDTTELLTACGPLEAESFLQAMSEYVTPIRPTLRAASNRMLQFDAGPLDALSCARILVGLQPDGAVVIDESNTAGGPYRALMHSATPHIRMGSTAGALGFGMAAAIGAAIAAPQRRVLNLQSDGAAAYSPQALWTQARERLDVTTVLFDNGGYETVRKSWGDFGGNATSPTARRLSELGAPALDWVRICEGFGVAATRVSNAEAFHGLLKESFSEPGPRLIVVDVARR